MTRPAYHLGRGGDYRPHDMDLRARVIFLRAVERVVPEALAELRTLNVDDAFALAAWCYRRGFIASGPRDWLRETARVTAIYLQEKTPDDPKLLDRFQWAFHTYPSPITITWDPFTEREQDFAKRVEEIRREVARRPDLVRVRTIRSVRAFAWLALYQVGGLTFAQIAARGDKRARRAVFLTPEAIRDAVRRLAADVGIALRHVPRGRPKKRRQPE